MMWQTLHSYNLIPWAALERQDLSCTHLAHHQLESIASLRLLFVSSCCQLAGEAAAVIC